MRRRLWSRPSTKMPGRVPRRPSPEDAFKNLICDPGVRSINNMLGPADSAGRTDALNAPPGLTCAGGIFHHRRGCSGLQTFARAQARAPSLIPRHGFRPALAETWLERNPPPLPHTQPPPLAGKFSYTASTVPISWDWRTDTQNAQIMPTKDAPHTSMAKLRIATSAGAKGIESASVRLKGMGSRAQEAISVENVEEGVGC